MGSERYDFRRIEKHWQEQWETTGLFRARERPRDKFYMLEMFAYPSGDIHMGHFRNYSVGDAVARYQTMQGHDVLHPFGWDAFGLPAENAAIDRGIHPREWTEKNIATGRRTLMDAGIGYDWSREVVTCRPEYYRWSQWLFLLLFKRGLAYRDTSYVNWCPSCKTVLANDQVVDAACERCHTPVSHRELEQWFFRTTEYAERLLEGLDMLDGWPESIKTMQRNWIGRSEGCRVTFAVEGFDEPLTVFTTRADTLYGVTFLAVAPESPWARRLVAGTDREEAVAAYVDKAVAVTEFERTAEGREKDGVDTGRVAIHPLSGEKVRIYVADYVLAGYGTGVVMGVPAHDQRDFEFARKYGIEVKVVIQPPDGAALAPETMEAAYVEPGIMTSSGPFDGRPSEDGIREVAVHVEEKDLGGPVVVYRLRDWLISRQRYWGTPIPIVHCGDCGAVPVPEEDLPVLLPENVTDFLPKGRSPLADVGEFMEVPCPSCGKAARRDPDTMDTFMCSSWYHLRYADAGNQERIFDEDKVRAWLPVDLYIGGATHATGHLIYFRFITKVLADAGYLDFDEPALGLVNQGMVKDREGRVMSKRLGNAPSPVKLIEEHGVDALRVAMFFFAPTRDDILWNDEGAYGARRFLNRVYDTVTSLAPRIEGAGKPVPGDLSDAAKRLRRKAHEAIGRMTDGLQGDLRLNTGIAAVMELVNALREVEPATVGEADLPAYAEAVGILVKILGPVAPHLAEELHFFLGGRTTVFKSGWPAVDESALLTDEVEVAVQVNGKVRGRIRVPADLPEEEVVARAQAEEGVIRHLEGMTVKKAIYVPGRLVSLVVR